MFLIFPHGLRRGLHSLRRFAANMVLFHRDPKILVLADTREE